MSNLVNMQLALAEARDALELIATPARSDGTYNRCRTACESLASAALRKMDRHEAGVIAPIQSQLELVTPAPKPLSQGNKFTVYSDGGSKGNPGPSGWGAVLLQDGVVVGEAKEYIGVATNQVAELCAAIGGISLTPEGSVVELISDSQYTLKGLSEWRKGWESRGWRNSAGEPVANKSHWLKLFALADRRKVTTKWVRGHTGDTHNERCDALANEIIAANR